MAAASSISLHLPILPSAKFRRLPRTRIHLTVRNSASVSSTEKHKIGLKSDDLWDKIASTLAYVRRSPLEMRNVPLLAEIAVDQAIISCRFFSVIAAAGSLVGSILCFVEGCFLMLESYMEGFRIVNQGLDQGAMIHMVIEAIDMFLIGTVMLNFGMGLYSLFIGFKRKRGLAHGAFQQKMLPDSLEMSSMSHAKTKLGQAVVMLLQVGVVEKFKSVPLTTGLDLACFAGALLFSSASMFLLSQLRASPESKVPDHRKVHSMNVI